MNRWAFAVGFSAGTLLVLWTFFRELSDNAEKMRLERQSAEEAEWRLFLQRWEAA